jgi:N-acetylmuramic acid 6-phosphate (MurNAc-6-P) etherase
MLKTKLGAPQTRRRLKKHGGHVRRAIESEG